MNHELRSNREGEFTCREFNVCYQEHGIKRQLSLPYSPDQNGIVERRNRLVVEVARAMLFENDVPKTFWREVVNTAMYTLNRVLDKKRY